MLQVIEKPREIRHCRLAVGRRPSPGLQVVPGVFALPARVGVGHGEDVAVPGFDCRGLSKPPADLDPPGEQSGQPKFFQLLGVGWSPVTHYGCHSHSLAPLQGPGLGQGGTGVPQWAPNLEVDPIMQKPTK